MPGYSFYNFKVSDYPQPAAVHDSDQKTQEIYPHPGWRDAAGALRYLFEWFFFFRHFGHV
jgi:hypothetical protein